MKSFATLFVALLVSTGGCAWAQGATPTVMSGPASFWQGSISAETKKDYDTAIRDLQGYLNVGGDPFLGNLRTGWICYLKQNYRSAIDSYTVAARLKPTALNPLLGLLSVAEAQGDAIEIRKAVDNILHLDPLNYRAQVAGATQQFKTQNYREALSYYRRVLQYYPDDLDAISGEAWSLYYLGQSKQAADDFQILLSVNPDYPQARQGLDVAQGKPAIQPMETL